MRRIVVAVFVACAGLACACDPFDPGPLAETLPNKRSAIVELTATFVTDAGSAPRTWRCVTPPSGLSWTSYGNTGFTFEHAAADWVRINGRASPRPMSLVRVDCSGSAIRAGSACKESFGFFANDIRLSTPEDADPAAPIVYALEGAELEGRVHELSSIRASGPASCTREAFTIDWNQPARLTVTFQ